MCVCVCVCVCVSVCVKGEGKVREEREGEQQNAMMWSLYVQMSCAVAVVLVKRILCAVVLRSVNDLENLRTLSAVN